MKISRYFRFMAASLVVWSSVAYLGLSTEGQARETYVQLAQRLLTQPPEGATLRPDLEAVVLKATNAYRATLNLPPLKSAGGVLLSGARAHAVDLLAQQGMGHVSSGGHDFVSRMRALNKGQMFLAAMAENAAKAKSSKSDAQKAQYLVAQWIKSSGHRKNMVNRTYTSVAIGVVTRGSEIYAVQIFSGPKVKSNFGLTQH